MWNCVAETMPIPQGQPQHSQHDCHLVRHRARARVGHEHSRTAAGRSWAGVDEHAVWFILTRFPLPPTPSPRSKSILILSRCLPFRATVPKATPWTGRRWPPTGWPLAPATAPSTFGSRERVSAERDKGGACCTTSPFAPAFQLEHGRSAPSPRRGTQPR